MKIRRGVATLAAATVALAGCGGSGEPRAGAASDTNLTVEGARAYVLAEIQRLYGRGADPHIASLAAERTSLDGAAAFRLEVTAGFTRDGRQQAEQWTFWVGFADDGEAGVLRSEGPGPTKTPER